MPRARRSRRRSLAALPGGSQLTRAKARRRSTSPKRAATRAFNAETALAQSRARLQDSLDTTGRPFRRHTLFGSLLPGGRKPAAANARRDSVTLEFHPSDTPDLTQSLRQRFDPHGKAPEDNEFYSAPNLMRRESLLWDPAVMHALDRVWTVTDRNADGEIDAEEYYVMHFKMCLALLGRSVAFGKLRKFARADWESDRQGQATLDRARFKQSWFELADRFTDTIDAADYSAVIIDVMMRITTIGADGQARWRSDEDILNNVMDGAGRVEGAEELEAAALGGTAPGALETSPSPPLPRKREAKARPRSLSPSSRSAAPARPTTAPATAALPADESQPPLLEIGQAVEARRDRKLTYLAAEVMAVNPDDTYDLFYLHDSRIELAVPRRFIRAADDLAGEVPVARHARRVVYTGRMRGTSPTRFTCSMARFTNRAALMHRDEMYEALQERFMAAPQEDVPVIALEEREHAAQARARAREGRDMTYQPQLLRKQPPPATAAAARGARQLAVISPKGGNAPLANTATSRRKLKQQMSAGAVRVPGGASVSPGKSSARPFVTSTSPLGKNKAGQRQASCATEAADQVPQRWHGSRAKTDKECNRNGRGGAMFGVPDKRQRPATAAAALAAARKRHERRKLEAAKRHRRVPGQARVGGSNVRREAGGRMAGAPQRGLTHSASSPGRLLPAVSPGSPGSPGSPEGAGGFAGWAKSRSPKSPSLAPANSCIVLPDRPDLTF